MKFSVLLLLTATLLSACQNNPLKLEDSPYATLPAGSTLVQHKDLILPTHTFLLQFQNGQQLSSKDIDQYYANCELESKDKADSARTIKAGVYKITHSTRYEESSSLPVMVASNSVTGFMYANASYMTKFLLSMDLQSDLNPNIMRFTCSAWSEQLNEDYLTLKVIRQTLNPLFSIKLPGEK